MPTITNILLADDDADDRYFFKRAIESMSPVPLLSTVSDGQKLMEYLAANIAGLPDIIFLDLNMPRKNGQECLIEIKNDARFKHIPIVAYSTSLRDETANILYKNGAHYYLHKSDYGLLAKNIAWVLHLLSTNPGQPLKEQFIVSLQEV